MKCTNTRNICAVKTIQRIYIILLYYVYFIILYKRPFVSLLHYNLNGLTPPSPDIVLHYTMTCLIKLLLLLKQFFQQKKTSLPLYLNERLDFPKATGFFSVLGHRRLRVLIIFDKLYRKKDFHNHTVLDFLSCRMKSVQLSRL